MLNRYIFNLLFENDCVIIPNFGGFVANYSPAKIHPVLHTFTPPSKQLTFNKSLVVNDGLLASTIANDQKISFAEAMQFIAENVMSLQDQLASNKNVEIEGVGTLSLDIEKNLLFNAIETENFNLHSFGLSSFQYMPIRKNTYGDRLQKKPADRAPIKVPTQKYPLKKYWPVVLALPIFLLLILTPFRSNFLGYVEKANFFPNLIEPSIYQPRKNQDSFSVRPLASVTKTSTANQAESPIISKEAAPSENISLPEKSAAEPIKKDFTNPVELANQFHLIGGCFKEEINAEKFIEQLNLKGFHAYIVGKNPQGLIRVSCSSFSKKSDAELAKNELQSNNMDVWVYEN